MASKQLPTSSSSDANERKRKRKISNRESARRSRMRKQKHLDELIAQEKQVHEENKKLRQMIDSASQMYLNFSSENNVLRAQGSELTGRLQSLNSVLFIASEVSGMAFDYIPSVPEALLEPWQLPCPVQPIPASADIFRY
ncbi:LOW QUALITY PROTEIN: bZIP transcription factor 53-like [Primulina huaijiensis]|uniref:LOW QUALITY PROTEIN: bZIP transcription factor 53-like n=1 Tax=Primulina huaijiensis TaxID=1492673 RepID=UPI003CC71D79